MKPSIWIGAVIVAAVPLVAAPLPETQTTKKGPEAITVSGCVQRETDYRKAHDKGRAGVAGTGIGAENEFVLTNVTGGGERDMAYELTGDNEKLAGPHVNHRVEISGTLKAEAVDASGKPTGGATAGKPPKGVDVVSKDLRLRELQVGTVKMVSPTCTP